jgi:hypothetical protein
MAHQGHAVLACLGTQLLDGVFHLGGVVINGAKKWL